MASERANDPESVDQRFSVARDPSGEIGHAPEKKAADHWVLALQRQVGNAAVAASFSIQRQRRNTNRPPARRGTRPAPGSPPPATRPPVTRVVVVTTNDDFLLPVRGAPGQTVPQQELWRATARALAAEPAPEGGRTEVIEATSQSVLEGRLRALSAQGARVSRFDFVGHGHPHGFNLSGSQANVQQWVSAADIATLVRTTGVSAGVRSMSVQLRACYTDSVAGALVTELGRAGFPGADVRGVAGGYRPGYAPPGGRGTTRDRRNWQVSDPGTNMRGGQPEPRLSPGELRGL